MESLRLPEASAVQPLLAVADSLAQVAAQPLISLHGVGPRLAAQLAKLGLSTIEDLWFHLPLRYEDRTRITTLRALAPDAPAQVEGVVTAVERSFRFRPQLRVAIEDGSGAALTLRFFHFNRSQAEALAIGTRLRCFGDVRPVRDGFEMVHPRYQRVDSASPLADRLTPVYPLTEGVAPARLARLVELALSRLPDDPALELLPGELSRRLGNLTTAQALRLLHRPPVDVDMPTLCSGTHTAQRRLAFEELLGHQLSLRRQRKILRSQSAPTMNTPGARRARLLASLPYALTSAQRRVLEEIDRDIASGIPMLRLLQGDVGSGKTIVAACAALAVIDAGFQVALMAPTELLAEQHLRNFEQWLGPLGVRVVWLAGNVKGRARQQALAAAAGDGDMLIGTQALMQEGVSYARLALVLIDEQHRFGVHQRMALRDKRDRSQGAPHQLVMTATPIPRTLAMHAYADLDVSVIDELPPGRTPITTAVIGDARRAEVIERIRDACAGGRQAYWVCTLVEESAILEAQAASSVHAELEAALPGISVGLLHGRMKAAEKQAAMSAFQQNRIGLLVATTVIEVGVDVANASLMVIDNAERLGLAQLHQLRGRIGRGATESSCVLIYRAPLGAVARERLAILRESTDGFRIADKDLELRGPGELMGVRQTGMAVFRAADLVRDAALLPEVQAWALRFESECPERIEPLVRRWVGAASRFADS